MTAFSQLIAEPVISLSNGRCELIPTIAERGAVIQHRTLLFGLERRLHRLIDKPLQQTRREMPRRVRVDRSDRTRRQPLVRLCASRLALQRMMQPIGERRLFVERQLRNLLP